MDNLNHLHPFREGNGRTQRLAIKLLAKEKNYDLDLNPPDKPNVYQEYMRGTIKGDLKALTILIHDNMRLMKTQ